MDSFIPAWVDGTLVPVDKIDVHRAGLRHPAVSVFVTAGDAVLLQRRALGKYHTPGLWANACCTHPRWNEAPVACAKRRLREELGITGLAPEHRGQLEYRADVGQGMTEHEVVDIYLAKAGRDLVISPDPAEVMDVRWTPFAALVDDVKARPGEYTPWLRIYLHDHSATIFG